MRRACPSLLALIVVVSAPAISQIAVAGQGPADTFELNEITIAQVQAGLTSGRYTSRQLVELYLKRIEAIDRSGPSLHSVSETNPEALTIADALDAERKSRGPRGPLHGVPILIKDNIDTADRMSTTAGSLALEGSIAARDAFVVRQLRLAGAILLGKTNLSEWANYRSTQSSSGWSGRGGQVRSPYVLDRNPCGSSSGTGVAIAANLATAGVGTETDGSIVCPSAANGLVGIKPTVGLISRDGIIPITADQDTAGPLARTVTDAAIVLGVIAGFDPNDPATAACLKPGNCRKDYTRFLDANALHGARIVVPPFPDNRAAVMNNAIAVLRAQGAYVETRTVGLDPQLGGCPSRPPAANYPPAEAVPPALRCSTVLNYGFKRDLNQYIRDHVRHSFPIHSLEDVVNFNTAHMPAATKYDQDLAIFSQLFDLSPASADTARYNRDRAEDIQRSRGAIAKLLDGVDGIAGTDDDFDAFLASGNNLAGTPAKAGYPSIVVPGGTFQNVVTPPFPDGFNAKDGPAGVTFSGRAFSEPTLIGLAYAFEQATHLRTPPASAPPLPSDTVIKH